MADADRKQRREGKKREEGKAGDLLTCVKGVKRGRVRGKSGAQGGGGGSVSGGNSSLSIGHSLVTRGEEILEGGGGNRGRRKVSLPSLSPVIAFLFSSPLLPHPHPETPDFQARGHLNELLCLFLCLVNYSLLVPSTLVTNRPEQLIGILINSGRKPRFIRVKPLCTKTVGLFLLDTLVVIKLFYFI